MLSRRWLYGVLRAREPLLVLAMATVRQAQLASSQTALSSMCRRSNKTISRHGQTNLTALRTALLACRNPLATVQPSTWGL